MNRSNTFDMERAGPACGREAGPVEHDRRGVRLPLFSAGWLLCCLLFLPAASQARINVVSLPGRDSVQLTIYNSVDLTMVKETRLLTFREGLNRLEFSWANTLIDPTSVEFRALTHADEIQVLDVRFPPRVTNTLEWRIQSEFAGEVEVEIRYFTSGIRWAADYVAEASSDETTMAFSGHVRVWNESGEDYENAQVRLVVGVIRLVEEIAALARASGARLGTLMLKDLGHVPELLEAESRIANGVAALYSSYDAIATRKEIAKEQLSEYFLYTVEGRDSIPHGWSKRLPSFQAAGVPVTSLYKFEKERWGDAVMRSYEFTNDTLSHLGNEPLPEGAVKVFRLHGADALYAFVGSAQTKYIPVNETVELELGPDQEVLVKPVLMNWEKIDLQFNKEGNVAGWTIRETWKIELQNSRDIPVKVDLRRNFDGDWSLDTEHAHEKVDATKVKFIETLHPRQKKELTYAVTTRHGTSVRR
jgi:hypothetical protein